MGNPKLNLLSDDLEINERLGSGRHGQVYKAAHQGNVVAVKFGKKSESISFKQLQKNFRFESSLMAKMNHVGIAQVHSVGASDDTCYIAMEFFDGHSLAHHIHRRGFPPEKIMSFALEMASILAEVHRHGIIHRDIKPDNIIISENFRPKLIDFGLGQDIKEDSEASTVGTLDYCSPEQSGVLNNIVDHRSDLYSLGVVLFELITGHLPYHSHDASETIRSHAFQAIPQIQNMDKAIPGELASVVYKLLAKDPSERHSSANALFHTLKHIAKAFYSKLEDIEYYVIHKKIKYWDEPEFSVLKTQFEISSRGEKTSVVVTGDPESGAQLSLQNFLTWGRNNESICTYVEATEKTDSFSYAIQWFNNLLSPLVHLSNEKARQNITDYLRTTAEYSNILGKLSHVYLSLSNRETDKEEFAYSNSYIEQALSFALVELLKSHRHTVTWFKGFESGDKPSLNLILSILQSNETFNCLTIHTNTQFASFQFSLDVLAPRKIHYSKLNDENSSYLIQKQLGRLPIDPDSLQIINNRCKGEVPLLTEYLNRLIVEGALYPKKGLWTIDMQLADQVKLSNNIKDILIQRLQMLNETNIGHLKLFACYGLVLDKVFLSQLDKSNNKMVQGTLDKCIVAGLIESQEFGSYSFINTEIVQAIAAQCSDSEKCDMHDQIFVCLNQIESPSSEIKVKKAEHILKGHRSNLMAVKNVSLEAAEICLDQMRTHLAYEILSDIQGIIEVSDYDKKSTYYLKYADACEATKRYDKAVEFYKKSLPHFSDSVQRAKLFSKLADIYNDNMEDEQTIYFATLGLKELGCHIPKPTLGSWLKTLLAWIKTRVYFLLPGLFAIHDKNKQERSLLISNLYDSYGDAHYFKLQILNSIQANTLALKETSRIKNSKEHATNLVNYAVVICSFGLTRFARSLVRGAKQIADATGSVHVNAIVISREISMALGGRDFECDAIFENWVEKYLDFIPSFELVTQSGIYMTNKQIRGYAQEGLDWVNQSNSIISKYDCHPDFLTHFQFFNFHICCTYFAQLGNVNGYLEAKKKVDGLVLTAFYDRVLYCTNELHFLLEIGELGDKADQICQRYEAFKFNEWTNIFYVSRYWILKGYLHLYRWMERPQTYHKEKTIAGLSEALKRSLPLANKANLQPHRLLLTAALARIQKRYKKAERLLLQVSRLAIEVDSPILQFEVFRQLALLFEEMGRAVPLRNAIQSAYAIASRNGYSPRVKWMTNRFDLPSEGGTHSSSVTTAGASRTSINYKKDLNATRVINTLLKVNIASASTADPQKQIRAVLDETVSVLNAERIFLFLFKDSRMKIFKSVGRNSDQSDILEHEGYSGTVIERVRTSGKAFVVSGNDKGIIADSQSVVLNDLRSIIAAPVALHSEMIGVIYLDSRLARGIFSESDIELLTALSGHIGVALERAESTEIAMSKQVLEKDLEVAGAVQKLLLPPKSRIDNMNTHAIALYQSANNTGGDWWWHEQEGDLSRFILSDVTGHGAGPAMVTAVVSSCYRTVKNLNLKANNHETFSILNQMVTDICRGNYWMSMTYFEWDRSTKELSWATAASPGLFIMDESGQVEHLSEVSTAFGAEDFHITLNKLNLKGNERLLAFSDGVFEEVCTNGSMLGTKRLMRIFAKTTGMSTEQSFAYITEELRKAYANPTSNDDLTMILVDLKS